MSKPFLITHLDFESSISIAEMHDNKQTFALVGAHQESHHIFQTNKVVLWDEAKSLCVAEISFRSDVRAVKFSASE